MTTDIEQATSNVQAFYEQNPYPGLGDKLMMRGVKRLSPYFDKPAKVLYPGCGTGHGMVSMALTRPDLDVFGLDLSEPSLNIARQLAEKYAVSIEVRQGNYMRALPWPFKFRYISLEGTLHHTADPSVALRNLGGHLEDDGLIFINLYGKKYHRRRFEIIEMLDLLQQGQVDLPQRFALFKPLQAGMKTRSASRYPFMDISPRQVLHWLRRAYRLATTRDGITTNSVPWTAEFPELNQLWIDQYNNPNGKTYDIRETKELLDSANLEVVEMFSLGKVNLDDLPNSWILSFSDLDEWSQFRLMELYYPETGSVGVLARKRV